jgi:predicted kinase
LLLGPLLDSVKPPLVYPLTLMIGVPGSGKSFLATRLVQGNSGRRVISTDAIRARLFGNESTQGAWWLVWREAQRQLQQTIEQITQGQLQSVIYDATHARRRYRRQAIAQVRAIGFTYITGLWVDTPELLCVERNRQRTRQVPDAVIQRMHRQLMGAPPSLDEGLDCLIRYTSVGTNPTCFLS